LRFGVPHQRRRVEENREYDKIRIDGRWQPPDKLFYTDR
jgi:hypothetical protein